MQKFNLILFQNLHRMVDEEGFSPMEMARLLSERISLDNTSAGFSGEHLNSGNSISREPAVEASKQRPTPILKHQHTSTSAVKFNIKNISDDETEDPFQNHSASVQGDVGVAKSNSRLTRPSTSNFFEVRSELNSANDSLMESQEGSLNLDAHNADEVMKKM